MFSTVNHKPEESQNHITIRTLELLAQTCGDPEHLKPILKQICQLNFEVTTKIDINTNTNTLIYCGF